MLHRVLVRRAYPRTSAAACREGGRCYTAAAVDLATLYTDERVCIAHSGELFFCGWREAPTKAQMLAMQTHGQRIAPDFGPLALVNIAYGGVPKFSDDVRELATQFTRDPSLFPRARAHIVAMPGFRGVAVTAFINTFLLLGRPPSPTKVFSALDPGLVWVAQRCGRDVDEVRTLADALHQRLYAP